MLYADDMVLVSDNKTNLQEMLNKMGELCREWRVRIIQDKANIVQFRPKQKREHVLILPYLVFIQRLSAHLRQMEFAK